MLEYIQGTLVEATPERAVIDVNGIGYRISIPTSVFENLPRVGGEAKLFISTQYREDSQVSYGFLNVDARNFFEKLVDISGVGPRTALGLLSHFTLPELHTSVEAHDVKALSRVPGIGKKVAERLLLELRDKFDKQKISMPQAGPSHDAIQALISLGYTPIKAKQAVEGVLKEVEGEPPLSDLISAALAR